MEIVVKSRHCTPSPKFHEIAQEKLAKLDRFGHPVARVDVELSREAAPRQSATCERVELTLSGKGPVVRGEAHSADPLAALDMAISKVEARLRKLAGRRRAAHTHGTRPVASVRHAMVTAAGPDPLAGSPLATLPTTDNDSAAGAADQPTGKVSSVVDADGPFVVREKIHAARPMTRDQALEQMELVGHDFFLYCCAETGMPSVVYRRRAYDYGVLHLAVQS